MRLFKHIQDNIYIFFIVVLTVATVNISIAGPDDDFYKNLDNNSLQNVFSFLSLKELTDVAPVDSVFAQHSSSNLVNLWGPIQQYLKDITEVLASKGDLQDFLSNSDPRPSRELVNLLGENTVKPFAEKLGDLILLSEDLKILEAFITFTEVADPKFVSLVKNAIYPKAEMAWKLKMRDYHYGLPISSGSGSNNFSIAILILTSPNPEELAYKLQLGALLSSMGFKNNACTIL
ncbi:MAG: hypothetical protein HRT87_09150 [Legionellales bacterium]|nr:hypothetical protein [Legionellales bacterium]